MKEKFLVAVFKAVRLTTKEGFQFLKFGMSVAEGLKIPLSWFFLNLTVEIFLVVLELKRLY